MIWINNKPLIRPFWGGARWGIGWLALKVGATLSLPTTRSLGALWNCCDANRAFVALCTSNSAKKFIETPHRNHCIMAPTEEMHFEGKIPSKFPWICCVFDASNMGGIQWHHTAPFRAMRFKLTQLGGNLFDEIVAWENATTKSQLFVGLTPQ